MSDQIGYNTKKLFYTQHVHICVVTSEEDNLLRQDRNLKICFYAQIYHHGDTRNFASNLLFLHH
jgi:hypothetical protein